jgi:AraC-like DNA-binding protein
MIDTFSVNGASVKLSSQKEIPVLLKTYRIDGFTLHTANAKFGQLLIQRIKSPYFEISHIVLRAKENCVVKLLHKNSWLGAHVILKSDCVTKVKGVGAMNFKEGQCNLFALPSLEWEMELVKGVEYVWFNVLYPPTVIAPFVELAPKAGILTACIKTKTNYAMYEQPLHASFAALDVVKQILACTYTSRLRMGYFRIKTTELFLTIIALPFAEFQQKGLLSPGELEKWYSIKKFISENYLEHHSIASIARKFNTNTTYLKTGFRQVFGYGLFTFLIRIRMERAIELLQSSRLSIGRVAEATGYSSAVSFVKAFKKHFGYTPGKMRSKHLEKISV